ncbi:MAG: protoporphyrinogen oxidase, partial [Rhodobacteraceae bacterium]|nr:protoporphyrinogen oxidase [Paracoccaceae bacterium]
GQTRKIARFAADRLADAGHAVELMCAEDAEGLDLGRFDRAVLAGSVHLGAFQKALVSFAKENAAALAGMPTLFLSVSLAAAGDDAKDWTGLGDCLATFTAETGWTPGRVEHVAGAFRFGEYDFFRSWAMRWIARSKGEAEPAAGQDREYTDWAKLAALLDAWAAG